MNRLMMNWLMMIAWLMLNNWLMMITRLMMVHGGVRMRFLHDDLGLPLLLPAMRLPTVGLQRLVGIVQVVHRLLPDVMVHGLVIARSYDFWLRLEKSDGGVLVVRWRTIDPVLMTEISFFLHCFCHWHLLRHFFWHVRVHRAVRLDARETEETQYLWSWEKKKPFIEKKLGSRFVDSIWTPCLFTKGFVRLKS